MPIFIKVKYYIPIFIFLTQCECVTRTIFNWFDEQHLQVTQHGSNTL